LGETARRAAGGRRNAFGSVAAGEQPCGWPNGVGLGVTAADIGNLWLALMALLPNIAGRFCALGWRFGRKSKQPSG
jgi:hypothetical protein